MHQIRVQAATRGWPVRGDFLYGARLPFGPPAELPRDRVIALHARSLTFLHPIRYEPLTVTAPAPEAWRPWARNRAATVREREKTAPLPSAARKSPPETPISP